MDVQSAKPDLNISPKMEKSQGDILSMTMAALRLVSPWRGSLETESEKSPEDRIIALSEVGFHDAPNDCWVVIYDRVYDITTFLDEHPGGAEIILEYAGRDASIAFRGSGHSKNAARALDRFLVGELPMHERLYRIQGGLKLSDIPD